MEEITSHIYNLLKSNEVLRFLLLKSSDPYGIYLGFPQNEPPFPIVTIGYDGDSDGGIQSNVLPVSSTYTIKVYANNFESIKGYISIILNNNTINAYEQYVRLISLKWIWTGPRMYEPDYDIFYQPVKYVAKFITK
jgi:hypothetical protein